MSLPPVDVGIGGGTQNTSRLTLRCKGIQDMQCQLFATGLGPVPLFRRPGVLLSISISSSDNADPAMEKLGVIVAHRQGVHGCRSCGGGEGDERCYLCPFNPFYEVMFENRLGIEDEESLQQKTVRVSPSRAFGRVVEIGACLLLRLSTVQMVLPGLLAKVIFHFLHVCFFTCMFFVSVCGPIDSICPCNRTNQR